MVVKVPVIMQLETLECGAACLAMILAYYGKWVPLEKVRLDCGVSRDGSSALSIVKAARNYGLEANGFKATPGSLALEKNFPCIIHWNMNHFVVLRGFKKGRAYLNDPANGDYSVSMDLFDKCFTGICLTFSPSENFEKGGSPKSIWTFSRRRLAGSGFALLFVVLTSIIISFLGFVNPVLTRVFADKLLTGENPDWVMPFMYILLSVCILQIVVEFIKAANLRRIDGKMSVMGSASFMWKLLHLPMEFFSQRMPGDLLNRLESNSMVSYLLVNIFAPVFINMFMLVFYLVVMIRYSVLLSVIGVASVAINIFIFKYISKKRLNISRVEMRNQGNLASETIAGIEMIETIKATGSEKGFFERWAGFQAGVNVQECKFNRLNLFVGLLPSFVTFLANSAILGIGVCLILQGEFSVGMLMAFQALLMSFYVPVGCLIGAGQSLFEMRLHMERIDDVMQYGSCEKNVPENAELLNSKKQSENVALQKLSGQIEIKDLFFGYSKLSDPLIKNFSMTIKAGEKIAFVGMSGCGKSTLSKLISGLYKPWSGEILFDGKPVDSIDRDVFTSSLSVVDQNIILFEDTVANNIRMWDESIEDFEVVMAARDARLHDVIMQREGGYSFMIHENGKNLSGGECQRIEIARVLAQDPTIVILDEATSALDAETEAEVVKSITARGITCIVIAHRLSTLRDCDEIVVFDHGEPVERGTHDSLMALNGHYTKMVVDD